MPDHVGVTLDHLFADSPIKPSQRNGNVMAVMAVVTAMEFIAITEVMEAVEFMATRPWLDQPAICRP